MKKSKELLVIFLCISVIFFQSCSPKVVPGGSTNTQVRDSVVIQLRDSVVVIPVEKVVEVADILDTLEMESSVAKAKAWHDTTLHMLRGTLENKKEIQYKYVYKDRWHTRDSIVEKEVPVPYEVEKTVHPKYEKWLWIYLVASLLLGALFLYLRFGKTVWL